MPWLLTFESKVLELLELIVYERLVADLRGGEGPFPDDIRYVFGRTLMVSGRGDFTIRSG
jgi:hypothetical protein